MQRRHFLKLALGLAAGTAAFAAAAEAAPLAPQQLTGGDNLPRNSADAHPAVTSAGEVGRLGPEQVHWGYHHWRWHRRHWGWHHRHWGWHRRWRHWHRHHWRHW